MTLGDLSNYFLLSLQEQGPQNNSGPPLPAPGWAGLNNPPFSQSIAYFYINLSLPTFYSDLSDTELVYITSTFSSTATTFKYPVPVAIGGVTPSMNEALRCFYQPVGQTYTYEFEPGIDFISWEKYQVYTAQGYLQTTSAFSTIPFKCAIDPQRLNLYFYPGSANNGDTITFTYCPNPTAGIPAQQGGTLVADTDVPMGPPDGHIAIAYKALELAWIKARESNMAAYYGDLYKKEVKRVIWTDQKASRGTTYGFKNYNWSDRSGINSPVIRVLG